MQYWKLYKKIQDKILNYKKQNGREIIAQNTKTKTTGMI
jgi:hypothetical protein